MLWKALGWIIGVSIYGVVTIALKYFGDALDLPSHPPGSTRHVTMLSFYGLMSTALGGVLGLWAGLAVYKQCLWAAGDRKAWLGLLCAVVALAAMVVMAIASHLVVRNLAVQWAGTFQVVLNVVLLFCVAGLSVRWWRRACADA
jgi:hypothetical protein